MKYGYSRERKLMAFLVLTACIELLGYNFSVINTLLETDQHLCHPFPATADQTDWHSRSSHSRVLSAALLASHQPRGWSLTIGYNAKQCKLRAAWLESHQPRGWSLTIGYNAKQCKLRAAWLEPHQPRPSNCTFRCMRCKNLRCEEASEL